MNKFKVGDEVRCIGGSLTNGSLTNKHIMKIIEILEDDMYTANCLSCSVENIPVRESDFELIDREWDE